MEQEIERKFLVKEIPSLTGIKPVHYERYFLQRGSTVEERIQKKDNTFEYEKKVTISPIESHKEKKVISEEEYSNLKQTSSDAIIRNSFVLNTNPEVSLKIYEARFKGLVRAEVEFKSVEEAKSFTPFDWMGKEITNSPLGRDSKLLDLTDQEFQELLHLA